MERGTLAVTGRSSFRVQHLENAVSVNAGSTGFRSKSVSNFFWFVFVLLFRSLEFLAGFPLPIVYLSGMNKINRPLDRGVSVCFASTKSEANYKPVAGSQGIFRMQKVLHGGMAAWLGRTFELLTAADRWTGAVAGSESDAAYQLGKGVWGIVLGKGGNLLELIEFGGLARLGSRGS